MSRDERAILSNVLASAGVDGRIDESRGYPVASFSRALPGVSEETSFVVDAPSAWVRVATTLASPAAPISARHAVGALYGESGLGHVHYDERIGSFRIIASLQAVADAPPASAVVAVLTNLARIRHKLKTGEGSVRASGPDEQREQEAASDAEHLDAAAAALGRTLSIVKQADGSWIGGLHEPRSNRRSAIRVSTSSPGIFALEAWVMPPARIAVDEATVAKLDQANASLDAGALVLFPDGFLVYRWACPYACLRVDDLHTPAAAQIALEALLRFAP